MPQLSIFCCPLHGATSGLRVHSRGECLEPGPGLETSGAQVFVHLQAARSSRGKVEVRLLPEYENEYCDAGTPSLRFGRAVRRSPTGVEEAMLDDLALILKHPKHCRWLATTAQAHGPQTGEPRRIGPIVVPEVPGGNARSRPVLPAANGRSMVFVETPQAVPGDLLSLVWDFAGPGVAVSRVHAGGWMETPCLRGGRVVETAGEEGEEDRRLLVQGHGGWAVCAASDHVPYQVGDWVFYSHVGSLCRRCEWWESYMTVDVNTASGGSHTRPDEEPRPVLEAGMTPQAVILPLVCGGFASESPVFEPYAPPAVRRGELGDLLDFCLRRGVVIEAQANGTLDVEMEWGREGNLPVHYHCPNAVSVAGGHTAFQPDDAVLVVSTRGLQLAHAVLGFADKRPRPCAEYILIAVGIPEHGGREFCLVWDAQTGRPAQDLPDGHGGTLSPDVFPCTRDVLQPWLDQSRPVPIQDQMHNLLGAERLGFRDTVSERIDCRPSPGRQCEPLTCDPPGECPTYPAALDGEPLGVRCGVCLVEDARANAHAGQDIASHRREITHVFADEEGHLHDVRLWREEHPFLCCERQAAAPHPATSLRCVWGDFTDVLQVSREYTAWREVWFVTDLTENTMEFSETVTDRIAFPGIFHRSAFAWTDVSHARRPVVQDSGQHSDSTREWIWNDRTVVVNGFGLRTHRSWLFAYAVVTRCWWLEPYVTEGVKHLHPGFDIVVAAGSGSTLEYPLSDSPFTLPTDTSLEAALTALLQAAFDDATFTASSIHSEFAFSWEVRA